MHSFSASLLGLPKLLKEDDIHAEYPSDVDDEHVTEKGYQPMFPGEPTRISSSLALFRCSRILSKVLEQNYPAAESHDLSLQSLTTLEAELDDWSDKLPAHLKLTFAQDKPSTDITGSRSALLVSQTMTHGFELILTQSQSLSYYYIRSLIHRPAVGSTLGAKSSSSVISLADSSKHLIQITQLLEERSMAFSFCLNRNSMLTLCGLSLLYQGLDLKHEGKLMQDNQRLVNIIIRFLEKSNAPSAADFKKLASSLIVLDSQSMDSKTRSALLRTSTAMSAPQKKVQPQPYKQTSASISENGILAQQEKLRRATVPNILTHNSQNQTCSARSSYEGTRTDFSTTKRECRNSLSQLSSLSKPQYNSSSKPPNLDYLSLSNTPISSQPSSPSISRTAYPGPISHTPQNIYRKMENQFSTELGFILSSFDTGQANMHSAIYGGPAPNLPETNQTAVSNSNYDHWSNLSFDALPSLTQPDPSAVPGPAQSVFSFSGESHSSGDELSISDLGLGGNTLFLPDQMPPCEDYLLPMDPF